MKSDGEASSATGKLPPILLAIGAAFASIACIAVFLFEAIARHGKGPDWSISAGGLTVRHCVWLLVLAGIAWIAISGLRRAHADNAIGVISKLAVNVFAGLSLLFAFFAAIFTTVETFELAKHPNRDIYSLYKAACSADMERVERALADGASASERWTDNFPGDGGDALAAYFKCYKKGQRFDQELVGVLLAAGASLTSRSDAYGRSPLVVVLMEAPQEDRVPAVKYLVNKGLSPNGGSGSSWRPLEVAASRGDVDAVDALLTLGARAYMPGLADKLFLAHRGFCTDFAQREQGTIDFDIQKHIAVVDRLLQEGMKVTGEALQGGKEFCRGSENVMVNHVEARMNAGRGK